MSVYKAPGAPVNKWAAENGSGEGLHAPFATDSASGFQISLNGDGADPVPVYRNTAEVGGLSQQKFQTRDDMKKHLVNSFQRQEEIGILPGYKPTISGNQGYYRSSVKINENKPQDNLGQPLGPPGNRNQTHGSQYYSNQANNRFYYEDSEECARKAAMAKYKAELDQQIEERKQTRKAEEQQRNIEANKFTYSSYAHNPEPLTRVRAEIDNLGYQDDRGYIVGGGGQYPAQGYQGDGPVTVAFPFSGNQTSAQQINQCSAADMQRNYRDTRSPPRPSKSAHNYGLPQNQYGGLETDQFGRQMYIPPPPQFHTSNDQYSSHHRIDEPPSHTRQEIYRPPPPHDDRQYGDVSQSNESLRKSGSNDNTSPKSQKKDGTGDVPVTTTTIRYSDANWRPHPSQTTDQLRRKEDIQLELKSNLDKQIQEQKHSKEEQKRQDEIEEIKLQMRIMEDIKRVTERDAEQEQKMKEMEKERQLKLDKIHDLRLKQLQDDAKAKAEKRRFVPKKVSKANESSHEESRPASVRSVKPLDVNPLSSRPIRPAKNNMYNLPETLEEVKLPKKINTSTCRIEKPLIQNPVQIAKLPKNSPAIEPQPQIRPVSRPIRPAKFPLNYDQITATTSPEMVYPRIVESVKLSGSQTKMEAGTKSSSEKAKKAKNRLSDALTGAVARIEVEKRKVKKSLEKFQREFDMDIPEALPNCPHVNFSWA